MNDLQAILHMASKGKDWIIGPNASYYLPPTFTVLIPQICFVTGATGLHDYLHYPHTKEITKCLLLKNILP